MAATAITTLFWDIGGVILTNGWGRSSRKEATKVFDFDWEEFQDRHDLCFPALDAGLITLDEYLDRVLATDPGYCYAYYQKGQVLESAGDADAAKQVYRAGVEAATKKGDAHARSEIEGALLLLD